MRRSREAGEPAHGEGVDGPSETLPPTRPTDLKRSGRVKLAFSRTSGRWTQLHRFRAEADFITIAREMFELMHRRGVPGSVLREVG